MRLTESFLHTFVTKWVELTMQYVTESVFQVQMKLASEVSCQNNTIPEIRCRHADYAFVIFFLPKLGFKMHVSHWAIIFKICMSMVTFHLPKSIIQLLMSSPAWGGASFDPRGFV